MSTRDWTKEQQLTRRKLFDAGLAPDDYVVNPDGSVLIRGAVYFDPKDAVFRLNDDSFVLTICEEPGDSFWVHGTGGFRFGPLPVSGLREYLETLTRHV
jgi:hypothetical protein